MTLKKKRKPKDPVDLLLAKLTVTRTGCWEPGQKPAPNGYVVVIDQRGQTNRTLLGHRVMWEHFNGPVPEGFQIDHLCRNRRCCNPGHLEVVTPRENQMRSNSVSGINARKTHCPQEHPLSGDNLVINANGRRCCRICQRDSSRRQKMRGAVPSR